MTEFVKLKTFLHAAEHLSFSKAARQLHLTQPTISHHIKALEVELNVELFERSGGSVHLTEAGQLLLPWVRKLIRQSNEMREILASMKKGVVGQLRIACSTTSGKYILPQLAARFRQRYPGIQVSIPTCTSERVALSLLEGEAHLGVVSREIHGTGLESQVFFDDFISLIVPSGHPWVTRSSIEPEELLEESIIIREPTSGTHRVMLNELSKHDITPDDLNVFLELGNAEAIVKTVAEGYGVAFVSTLACACPMVIGSVVEVPVAGLDMRRKIHMLRKSLDTPHRPQEVFWSFVHDPANEDLLRLAGA